MTPQHAAWLLAHPLDDASGDAGALAEYRTRTVEPDGALLTVVLAVDR